MDFHILSILSISHILKILLVLYQHLKDIFIVVIMSNSVSTIDEIKSVSPLKIGFLNGK